MNIELFKNIEKTIIDSPHSEFDLWDIYVITWSFSSFENYSKEKYH